MSKQFPRTEVAGVSMPRMLIGTNWMLGWSHTSPAADSMIKKRYSTVEAIFPMLNAFLGYGINAVMGPVSQNLIMYDAIEYAKEKSGRDIILIDSPILNVDDTKEGRAEAETLVKKSASIGAKFCLLHHSSAEQLVNKNKRTIDRLGDYTTMIRENGMIPGLSAHMPELIVYSDDNEYDVETYIQIYNCMGFLMQIEVETVASIINKAKKPVMTIKPMAAGRCTPYVGLNFVWNTVRERDMVTVGCFNTAEIHEDVEISLAAIERRFPVLENRGSPNEDQAVFG